MPTPPADLALAHDLRLAVLLLARRIRAARVDTSLSLSQLSALAVLDVRGPMTAGDLAAMEFVQPPTMTRVLASLVDRELIRREPHPSDKRSVHLVVTASGHAAVDAERRARDAWLTRELDALDAADRERVAALLPLLERIGQGDPAEPHTPEPHTPEPHTAEPHAAEPHAPEPHA